MIEANIKNGMIADAISSVVQNKFVNLECELIQAIYDYCLADGQYEIIPFRSYTADNADDANKAFFTLNETLIKLTNLFITALLPKFSANKVNTRNINKFIFYWEFLITTSIGFVLPMALFLPSITTSITLLFVMSIGQSSPLGLIE